MDSRVSSRNYPLITAILCWAGMVVMSSLYVTIPLVSLFSDIFGVSSTQAASAGSIFSLGFAIGCLIYGALSDKYGRKRVIFIGLVALTVISLLLGLVDSFPLIIVLRGLQGAAAATFSPVALAYTVQMFPPEKRVTTIGFISTGFMVAGIVGQVVSGLVSEHYGWNAIFYLLAIVYAITAFLVLSMLPKEDTTQAPSSILEPIRNMGKVFAQKNLVFSYLISLVLLMSFVNMSSVLGTYLSNSTFGLSKQEILYVRSFGILGMLVSPFAGRLARGFGALTLLRGSLILAVLGLASIGFISNLPLLIIMMLVFIVGIAITVPSLVGLVGQMAGKMAGIAVSVNTFILFAGTSFGPIMSVQFMKTGSFSLTFILLALVLCVGLLAAFLIRIKSLT
ncbi:MFS transporter [Paenibacillus sp. LMG 31457]|uniref:MFS transporter n=2 Tax=Paenibacillus planticolens TaxID=2654976 RepID=A0ABX1ZQE2_9BACL|nr:MFS transporter [Paenibacillus planticolens]